MRRLGDAGRLDDLADRRRVVTPFGKKTSGRSRNVARHRAQLSFWRRDSRHDFARLPRMTGFTLEWLYLPSGRYYWLGGRIGQAGLTGPRVEATPRPPESSSERFHERTARGEGKWGLAPGPPPHAQPPVHRNWGRVPVPFFREQAL